MTIRVERCVATLALACLCNCATTRPDSTDGPSSLIDLPEQQKQNEDNPSINDKGYEAGEVLAETGSQLKLSSNDISDQSPKTVSELADLGQDQGEHSSALNQPDADETKSTPSDLDLSSKAEANQTPSTVVTQSEASDPSGEEKHPSESENFSDIDEITNDTNKFGDGNSNTETDAPLGDIFTKDSTSAPDSTETDRGEENPSGVNNPIVDKPLGQTDLEFSGSSEDPENQESSLDLALGFSGDEVSPPEEPENSGNMLAVESENLPVSPSLSSLTSDLGFSDASTELPGLEGVDSTSLIFREPHANGANLGSDKSTSIHFGPGKDTPLTGPTKSPRRYVGLSQWLSRSSSETLRRDDVYVGHSEPKVPVELESYIDESPLVGIEEPVSWEYDSIARLLQPREDGASHHSDKTGFDYESVRKFFGRESTMGTTEKNVNRTPTAFRYDGVLHWLDRRESASNPPQAKAPKARKYSNALNWIRNEGR
jgi:hypothetical protein